MADKFTTEQSDPQVSKSDAAGADPVIALAKQTTVEVATPVKLSLLPSTLTFEIVGVDGVAVSDTSVKVNSGTTLMFNTVLKVLFVGKVVKISLKVST